MVRFVLILMVATRVSRTSPTPRSIPWTKGQHLDLAAWQVYYRGSNNLFAAKSGALTNYFPIAKEPQSPAVDVLLALSRF
jgi:hypothetical protein